MSDSLNTLLTGLAEALAPYLGGSEDIDVECVVQNYVDSNFDFNDMVTDAISDVDWDDHEILTQRNFDPSDYDLMDTSDIDVAIDEAVDAKIGEALESVVTVDNILSILALALAGSEAGKRAA